MQQIYYISKNYSDTIERDNMINNTVIIAESEFSGERRVVGRAGRLAGRLAGWGGGAAGAAGAGPRPAAAAGPRAGGAAGRAARAVPLPAAGAALQSRSAQTT